MAEEQVVIQVAFDTGKANSEINSLINELDDLLQQQAALRKDESKSAAERAIENKKLAEQIGFTTTKIRGLQKATETANKTAEEYGDTLNDERKKLADMQKAYAALTKAERESAAGKEFQQKIKAQHDAVLEMEKGIGQMQRNVGNYAESISQAFGGAGGAIFGFAQKLNGIKGAFADATGGAKGFSGALKAMSAIGIVAVLSAIVAVVTKIGEVFASSEERTNRLRKAFAPLQGLLDLVTAAFSKICDILLNQFETAIDAAIKGVRWLAVALDKVGEWLGKDWHFAKSFDEAAAKTTKLAKLEEAYTKHKRAWITEEAELEKERAELSAKAADKEKYTAAERLKYLERANAIELKLAKERTELAKEHLAVLQADADRADNDAAANDALAEAQAEVTRQQTAYFAKQKELVAKINEARKAIAAENDAQLKEAQAFADSILKAQEDEINAEIAAEEKRQAEEIALMLEAQKQAVKIAEERKKTLQEFGLIAKPTELEQELELLKTAYDNDLLTYEEYEQAKALINEKYEEKKRKEQEETLKKAQEAYSKAAESYAKSGAQGFTALGDALSAFMGENEKASELQKGLAIGAILMQEAQAIAAGARAIAEAQAGAAAAAASTGPAAPATFAAYSAEMVGAVVGVVASVASSIVQAKKILSQASSAGDGGKFAKGGIVGGTSYAGDRLTAHVNSREMILTTGQQKRLFDIANGGKGGAFNYELFAQSVASAVANAPAPVMEYSEFKKFENRVTNYNEITKI